MKIQFVPSLRPAARITAEIERRIGADVICLEARGIGMRVGAVPGQHRHALRRGEKILVVSSEAESAGGGDRYCRGVGDGQQLEKVVRKHGQAVAGSERMNPDRREGKAEGSQAQRSLRKIADADDKVVDAAGHGGLRGLRTGR